jgi:dihydroflavonol-4-reductase
MARALVTGATGFIGTALTRQLAERGDDLRLLVREGTSTADLDAFGAEVVRGDITDRRAVQRAVRGCERVFHVAGVTSLRADPARLFRINVEGTRTVMQAALKAGVERVVHTSSIAAVGPAPHGGTVDERHLFDGARLGIPYANSKREAEVEALRYAARGLPVVVVNPAHVLGWGDTHRSSTEIVRRFMLRRIPAYVDGAICTVDVEDVAAGHLLADERGEVGERYILGNRNFTFDRLFADLGRMSGIEPPAVKLPVWVALTIAEGMERMPGPPPFTTGEVRAVAQWWTCRNTKAKRELGWRPRPADETLQSTVDWWFEQLDDRLKRSSARQPLPLRFAGGTLDRARGLADIAARVIP